MTDALVRQSLLFLVLGGYGAGAIASLLFTASPRWEKTGSSVGFVAAAATSLLGCLYSLSILFAGATVHVELIQTLPTATLTLHVDPIAAFFLLVISVLGVFVSIYSPGYMAHAAGNHRSGILAFLFNVFLLTMALVVVAGDAVLFLIVWEMMSLTTYFLITHDHSSPASQRAGFLYVIMTHVGTAFLIVMFLLLFVSTGSFSIAAWQQAGPQLPSNIKTAVFFCALIGFGMKAGIIPLHIWLPEAHPAAPSNVSALMSGVMIKTGIYGMVRVFFGILGPGPEWWGIVVLVIAVTSSVLGVLYALMEHDLKRLLAFHSIENIGIILMGIGAAMLFSTMGSKPLAALALVAALYHVLNHAVFKGLLFMGAGSVMNATGTRNMEELGGLAKQIPITAALFLVGSIAISALPPLNGFMSEWLTFQALLQGFSGSDLPAKIALPLTVALLALTGALAAACFVKAFGITFLGLPRSRHAEHAREAPTSMLAGMAGLAILCVVLGVVPGFILGMLDSPAASLFGEHVFARLVPEPGTLLIPRIPPASVSPAALGALLILLTLVPIGLGALLGGKLKLRSSNVWACGMERVSSRMQYTATGFSKPLRLIFSNIFRARHEIEVSEEASPYFHPRIRYELKTESVFERYFYQPMNRAMLRAARGLQRIQAGNIRSYLAYIFITLILLLMLAR